MPGGLGLSREKWTKPPDRVLKLNYDGSFLPEAKSGSSGFLIRDCDGDVITAGRGKIGNAFQAADRLPPGFCRKLSRLILETDAQEVVRALKSEAYAESAFGYLVEEIKSLCSLNHSSLECCFVKSL